MGKKAKSEAKKKRQAMKRTRKAGQRAKYEAWKAAGQNSKSKRAKLRGRRERAVRNLRHAGGKCGNIGCRRCNPINQNLLTPRLYAASQQMLRQAA